MREETRKIIEHKQKFMEFHRDTKDPEIKEMLDHIQKTDHFYMMNCDLQYNYNNYNVSYGYDAVCNFPYVIERGRKIYFPKSYDELEVCKRFRPLIAEQDAYSPHRYLDDECMKLIWKAKNERKRIVVVELGAMEGMFSLSIADIADELYLFECDEDWIEPLHKSFEPWQEKTIIINKFVGDFRGGTLDECGIEIKENTFFIVKMDIEGSERGALDGMEKLLSEVDDYLLFICVYHRQNDEMYVRERFSNDKIWHNKGYFCFYVAEDYAEPYVRRCVLKIKKRI